jgi:hypothetical protein
MLLNRFTRLKGVGRYACLGTAVLEVLGRRYKMHNIQKGRVDYLLQVMESESGLCRPNAAIRHLARDFIVPTVEQQACLCPDFTPELVLVDSFSDLTDQLFQHRREHWQFCCNYLDLEHSDEFADTFDSLGLLDLDGLQNSYESMLRTIEARWPGIPVIYIHFPDVLEEREKFVERAREIRRVVELCAGLNPNLYSFSVPAEIVKRPEVLEPGMENFPYHYNQATYQAFADLILGHPALKRYF